MFSRIHQHGRAENMERKAKMVVKGMISGGVTPLSMMWQGAADRLS
jgi:hypothetical protein